jgi:putative endonuclease
MWGKKLSPSQQQGRAGEQAALRYLKRRGLHLIETNFSCPGGEIDLILRDGATLVFVEVRERADAAHGGAAASIGPHKIRRIMHAAETYLQRFDDLPACRIDVVAIDGGQIEWLQNAIEG